MKNLLLLFCLLASAGMLQAQIPPSAPQLQKQSYGFKSRINPVFSFNNDTSLIRQYNRQCLTQRRVNKYNVDNMPVTGQGQVALTQLSNNGRGFDLYSATPDNMIIAKPDSTFYSSMPNAVK